MRNYRIGRQVPRLRHRERRSCSQASGSGAATQNLANESVCSGQPPPAISWWPAAAGRHSRWLAPSHRNPPVWGFLFYKCVRRGILNRPLPFGLEPVSEACERLCDLFALSQRTWRSFQIHYKSFVMVHGFRWGPFFSKQCLH